MLKKKINIEYFSAVIDAVAIAEGLSDAKTDVESEVTVLLYGHSTKMKLKTSGSTILIRQLMQALMCLIAVKVLFCCTCRAKVIEGKVKMDANFALTDGEIAQGYILTCQSHPLTAKVVVDYDA